MTVTIISDAMTATPEVFSIAGGQDIIVLLAVAGARVSDDVIIEADNGDVAIIDVDVTPLRTETVTKTVVDATVKISARTADSWAFNAPAGAVLNVSVSAGNDFDTWLTDDTTGDSVAGTVFGDTLRASYETDPLVEGPHTLVVSNRGAILFSRTVTVLAEIRWEQPIPAAD